MKLLMGGTPGFQEGLCARLEEENTEPVKNHMQCKCDPRRDRRTATVITRIGSEVSISHAQISAFGQVTPDCIYYQPHPDVGYLKVRT